MAANNAAVLRAKTFSKTNKDNFWIRTCVTGRLKIPIKNSSACINLVFNFVPQQPDSQARLLLPDVGLANNDDLRKDLKVAKTSGSGGF